MTMPGPESEHRAAPGAPMGASDWDERYAGTDLVWGAGANRWVVEQAAALPVGRAVDLACGEGRNALYLAERGWHVIGVDFSAVAIGKAARLQRSRPEPAGEVRWECADVTGYRPPPADLALLVYLHLAPDARRRVLANATAALADGGGILVVGHNARNIAEGTGGPQDPDILYTADDIVTDLAAVAPTVVVEAALEPLREVSGAARPAIDTVVRARRPRGLVTE